MLGSFEQGVGKKQAPARIESRPNIKVFCSEQIERPNARGMQKSAIIIAVKEKERKGKEKGEMDVSTQHESISCMYSYIHTYIHTYIETDTHSQFLSSQLPCLLSPGFFFLPSILLEQTQKYNIQNTKWEKGTKGGRKRGARREKGERAY